MAKKKVKKKKTRARDGILSDESVNTFVDYIGPLLVFVAFLALLSYYFEFYTEYVDIAIIAVAFLLSVDSIVYKPTSRLLKKDYQILGFLFLVVAVTHLFRFYVGPVHCLIPYKILSVYIYDSLAFVVGTFLFHFSLEVYKKSPRAKYHAKAGILVGTAMMINHGIKIVIGDCI